MGTEILEVEAITKQGKVVRLTQEEKEVKIYGETHIIYNVYTGQKHGDGYRLGFRLWSDDPSVALQSFCDALKEIMSLAREIEDSGH
jgi:hypothetical protein